MIRKPIRSLLTAVTLTVAALAPAGFPGAAELPREGDFDATFCFVGNAATLVQSKTDLAYSFDLTGPVRGELPGSLLDMTSVRCVGLGEVHDGVRTGTHRCVFVDRDGDQVFMRGQAAGTKTSVEFLGGSGKYAGISGNWETLALGSFPKVKEGTFQGCSRGGGRYRLP